MVEVAHVAGVGIGTVYRHFPTKDDLVAAHAIDRFARLADYARQALVENDPAAAFEGYLHRAGELQASDRALVEIMCGCEQVTAAAVERAGLLELTHQMLTRAQERGEIRPDLETEDIPLLMRGLGATTTHPAGFTGRDSWRRFLALILEGMRIGASELPPR